MTSSAERAALIAHARWTIERGSKSFRFASRLFGPVTRERSWLLYAWCRACDDLADGQSLGHAAKTLADPERRLRYLTRQTERALAGGRCDDPSFDALRILVDECRLPSRLVHDHIAGFARDCAGWSPETETDLLSYCYQVAGAVGCLMAILMGVAPDDEPTLDHAADLGIAFQLTNIARDIGDDHANGRCYLPAEWLADAAVSRADLMDRAARPQLVTLVQRLCVAALAYEASARVGAARLPLRSRWAVLSAARIYGAIAAEVANRGPRAWDSRIIIPKAEKLRHVIIAAGEAATSPKATDRSGLWMRPR